ncbi:hypothetical protein BpHYR1_002412 [Brachionus plicatilis]|uniref:Uncharacterized protein n=1 Tax=Brachionus plicatilis TaxID=10195 RepID=A0A3M7PLF3_BRAPC|nr:hypothetical protein BpHYR1_002412 [Brachionus plicatilis]
MTYSHSFEKFSAWLNGQFATELFDKRILNTSQQMIIGVFLILECKSAIAHMVQVFEPFKVGDSDSTSVYV